MSEPLVVIGNGMAAARFVDELTTRALGRYSVAVIGNEGKLAYNRVLLSSVLANETELSDIELKSFDWWKDRGVTLLYDHAAVSVDPAIRRVRLANGATLPYRHLVFATGSRPIRPGTPGMDLPGVLTFRDLGDVTAIRKAAGPHTRAVVIGGGLLGLEAAYGLAKAHANVTLLHLMDRLMERQLDPHAAAMLKNAVESRGVEVLLKAETTRIENARGGKVVTLTDGRRIEADLVVVAVGIHPNTDLARKAGADINRGIAVNDKLETSIPGHYAIGECAEHRGQCYGLVEPAYEQARILASHLAGQKANYPGSILSTNLKVSGVNVFSAGDFLGAAGTEQIVLSDPGFGTYKKLVIADGKLAGAVLFGDTADSLWYLELIRSSRPIAEFRNDLAFGRNFAERKAA
jgi:nitrite reductase (NADH) large subunit